MKVNVEEYSPRWADQFLILKAEIENILQTTPYVSIEHVGSTSVPGLAAKPVIDIDVVVQARELSAVIDALTTKGGYEYMGDQGIPQREAFRKPGAIPARNLYACIAGSQALRNHLAVREICTRDEAVRDAYGNQKRELAQRDWRDVDEYCEAKNDLLQWILRQADFSSQELDAIRDQNTANDREARTCD